jgi:hypothetical protein
VQTKCWGSLYRVGTASRGIGGGGRPAVSAASMASISKSKRRGWGDARVLFDEGKGGGTSGASIQLLLGAGGQAARCPEEGENPNWAGLG